MTLSNRISILMLIAIPALFPHLGIAETLATRSIAGEILLSTEGLERVWLMGMPGAPVSGSGGTYRSTVSVAWSGVVEPHLPGYRFEPATAVIEPGSEDLILNFDAIEHRPGFARLWWIDDDSDLSLIGFHSNPEDMILFQPGEYSETSDFDRLKDGVTLIGLGGASSTLLTGRATFKGQRQTLDGLAFELSSNSVPGLELQDASGFRLRNGRFQGTAQTQAMRVEDATEILIEGSEWQSSTDHGLLVREGTSAGNLVIRQSSFFGQREGIAVLENPDLGVRLENTRLIGQSIYGMEVRGSLRELSLDHVIFHDNRVGLDVRDVSCPVDLNQAVFQGQESDAVFVNLVDLSIHDSIFSENGCAVDGGTGAAVSIDHTFMFDDWVCNGPNYDGLDLATITRDVDPRFTDVVTDNFTLSSISPARGVGRQGQDLGAYGGALANAWSAPEPLAAPALLGLSVLDQTRHLAVGERVVFRAEGRFERGYSGEVGPSLSWSSSEPSVLQSLGDGEFEALASGESLVTAQGESGHVVEASVQIHESLHIPAAPESTPESEHLPPQVEQPENTGSSAPSPTKALEDPSGWALVDPLGIGRGWHTVTLLVDGRVLVTGGKFAGQNLSQTEIFDPATGRWKSAASMLTVRRSHSATLLGDGRVLVAGGQDSSRHASVEIYDPREDAWTSAADMSVARAYHSASLLTDGRVLVYGGDVTQGTAPSTSELYDPVQDEWFTVGPMPGRRNSPSAVRLDNGRVFSVYLDEAEVYLPDNFSWEAVKPPPRTIDAAHTSTLLRDGRVLVTGGSQATGREALIYDPEADAWLPAGLMEYARQDARAVLLADGRVLVAGGSSASGLPPKSTEIFDPATLVWQNAGDLSTSREDHAMTLLANGRVLLVAGQGSTGSTARCEIFQPALPAIGETGSLFEPRYDAAVTELADGRVMVAGGLHSGSVARVEIYDPADGAWTSAAPLGTAGGERTAILLPAGDVLVVGRFQAERWSSTLDQWQLVSPRLFPNGRTRAVLLASGEVLAVNEHGSEIFNPGLNEWRPVGSMVIPRVRPTLTLLPSGEVLGVGGSLLAAGNNAAGVLSSVEVFDPRTETWQETDRMSWARQRHVAALLPSGEVLVAGGDDGEIVLAESEIYSPETGFWRDAGTMTSPRRWSAAVGLADGRMWVTAGDDGQNLLTTTDVFEPATGRWRAGPALAAARERHGAALLADGGALVIGGRDGDRRAVETVELLSGSTAFERPQITSAPDVLRYGESWSLSGTAFGGGPEAHGGSAGHSTANHPVVQLQALEGGRIVPLVPDRRLPQGPDAPSWYDDPMTFSFSRLTPGLDPGLYHLSVWRAGIPSLAHPVVLECSLAILESPLSQSGAVGDTVRFRVEAEGARYFQWRKDARPIEGAVGPVYETPPIGPDDSGAVFDVILDSGCRRETSAQATLSVLDNTPPIVELITPTGGEIWPLPLADEPPEERTIVWEMSDDIRVCQVEVALEWKDSDDRWNHVEGWPQEFESSPCEPPGLETRNVTLELQPNTPPSGQEGSRYRIRVRARDLSGKEKEALSGEFSIIRGNPDNIRTLVITHSGRLPNFQLLNSELSDLIGHSRVLGFLVDLKEEAELLDLYVDWDEASERLENVQRANELLFGRGEEGTAEYLPGIHDVLRDKLKIFTGVEYLVVVGGDQVVPMARIRDDANLWGEEQYTTLSEGPLDSDSSPAGQALAEGFYLSDDLLAQRQKVHLSEIERLVAIPDLAVGRLVEQPGEISAAIRGYLQQDGGIALREDARQVFISGYDFLTDSAGQIAERWQTALTAPSIGADLIGNHWDSASFLEEVCSGEAEHGYRVFNFNGHATHFQEGIPNPDPNSSDILGVSVQELKDRCDGESSDLSGAIIYSVGCHGGLSVADAPDTSITNDLPQTYLGLGAAVYLANSGFGWGLQPGIGYSERLVELFSQQLIDPASGSVGRAFNLAKAIYFREIRHFDAYHQKTLMQWTYFGLPMYDLALGVEREPESGLGSAVGAPPLSEVREATVLYGEHPKNDTEPPPDHLVVGSLSLDFRAGGGVYQKFSADGDLLEQEGCSSIEGVDSCYWTLLGVTGSGSAGTGELPLEPYVVYETGLAGASQHGVLWTGGRYRVEEDWAPTFPELVSNNPDGQGSPSPLPQYIVEPPIDPVGNWLPTDDCRHVDEAGVNIVITTGEAGPGPNGEPWARHRRYLEMDMEIFYLGAGSSEPCDRQGPEIHPGPFESEAYHQRQGAIVRWKVPVTDLDSEVWRVMVLVDDGIDPIELEGSWESLELQLADGFWQGELDLAGATEARYFLQAVDSKGNVSWKRDELATQPRRAPQTGIEIRLPEISLVDLSSPPADLALSLDSFPGNVETSTPFEYWLRVENRPLEEPVVAGSIVVDIDLMEGVRFRGFQGAEDWSCFEEVRPLRVRCDLPFLDPGASSLVRVSVSAPELAGLVQATAQVRSAGADPNPADNTDSAGTFVVEPQTADIAVTIDNGADMVEVGAVTTYQVTLTNHGPAIIDRVLINLELSGLEDVTIFEPSVGVLSSHDWLGLGLATNDEATFALSGRVKDGTVGGVVEGSVWAVLPFGFHDPDDDNDFSLDIDSVADSPPRILTTDTVARISSLGLESGARTTAAISQLLLTLSERVNGTDLPGVHLLVSAGEDGLWQTETCAESAGDDVPWEVEIQWLENERLLAVRPTAGVLPQGIYRWQICPGLVDPSGQPLEGVPLSLDFEVVAEHLLSNPNFDFGLESWLSYASGGNVPEAIVSDAGDASTSGALRMAGIAPGDIVTLGQCVALPSTLPLTFAGKFLVPENHGGPQLTVSLATFADIGCVGDLLESETFDSPTEVLGAGSDWQLILPSTLQPSPMASSALLTLTVHGSSPGPWSLWLDDLALFVDTAVFRGTFETGDFSEWSSATP